ncbi:ring-cleaving dioxygenase [Paenibacillus sp. Cedars]|uniref:ring-cleaving dioxygenase n=1 Tax=Paenibacillus sp. Cedars TaxID=1980674 RepID=UPI001162D701|nr:ring-cleaving dioxygenase [Paenibacillus sp. Cedars]AWP26597.1 ring-cleaving dioxygenase [Paenibacillus sp. Cedars]
MHHIPGHHHISMLTKNAPLNHEFYHKKLGLRRVKKTVNQDNPSMYHLFYGDLTGSAGTELSFFEMPAAGRTVRGTNAITQIGLLVPSSDSLKYWKQRFEQYEVTHGDMTEYAGREALPFDDPEGLRLILINHDGAEVPAGWAAWEDSTVEQEHRILGMGPVEMTVRNLGKMAATLTEVLGYTEVSRSEHEAIYQSIEGQALGEIVVKQQDGPSERPGRGSVHHLAIRVNNEEELAYWNEAVIERGFQSTGIIDRFYFKSLYFREANGILFEIATDGPGFTADSSVEELGKRLDLPPFLEGKRAEIEAKLTPLDS